MTPIASAHHLNSVWRHYEEIPLPDGLLVVGDAVCAFNPTYGQGMTVAAVQAATLDSLLSARAPKPAAAAGKPLAGASRSADADLCSNSDQNCSSAGTGWLSGLHSEFQAAIHTSVKNAWDMAVGPDMKFPTATSNESYKPNVVERLAAAYVVELFKLAGTDFQVTTPTGWCWWRVAIGSGGCVWRCCIM
jgi:2-polyprenyl-6-methoxyphenol hydroxylase-like FAD-dependent oxidoreductase